MINLSQNVRIWTEFCTHITNPENPENPGNPGNPEFFEWEKFFSQPWFLIFANKIDEI
jgi:hypothetical protein